MGPDQRVSARAEILARHPGVAAGSSALPNTGKAWWYVVMDPAKSNQSVDLVSNGYIHRAMFKDCYNTKKHITGTGSGAYLGTITITKNGLFSNLGTPFARGRLGPHAIGPNANVPAEHRKMPYGESRARGANGIRARAWCEEKAGR